MAETLVQPDKLSDSQSEYMKLIAEIMEIRKGEKSPLLIFAPTVANRMLPTAKK